MSAEYRLYKVQAAARQPLVDFITGALLDAGCRILYASPSSIAPFRVTFETPEGERLGIVAYAFLANSVLTKNRPTDEHRFQVKFGPDDKKLHEIWTDPYLLYTTLFLGIDPEKGIFVGADPMMHNPTRFFISIEFKRYHVEEILNRGWYSWEREHRADDDKPTEVLVGGTAKNFLRYVRFERETFAEDPGHRQLLAEHLVEKTAIPSGIPVLGPTPPAERLHTLAAEFQMSESEVLDMIARARRLKMAVRGWVAEEHLVRKLTTIAGVTECVRDDAEGHADVSLRYRGSRPITVECKNVLRKTTADGLVRIDFQRTRASKSDPCSRYYSAKDFDLVAGCLHAVTEHWEFKYAPSARLDKHSKCKGKLSNNVKLDTRWSDDAAAVLSEIVGTI